MTDNDLFRRYFKDKSVRMAMFVLVALDQVSHLPGTTVGMDGPIYSACIEPFCVNVRVLAEFRASTPKIKDFTAAYFGPWELSTPAECHPQGAHVRDVLIRACPHLRLDQVGIVACQRVACHRPTLVAAYSAWARVYWSPADEDSCSMRPAREKDSSAR
jgi:hypothetical protein